MLEKINQPVQVAGIFKDAAFKPLKFLWHGKEFTIKKLNLMYSQFQGRSKIYLFTVSDDVNYFKLEFNSDSLVWTLLEIYTD